MVLKVLLLSACLALWLPAVIGGGPYFLVAERKAWQEAQDYCRSRYTDLASIKSQADLDLLAAVPGIIDAWIGLSVNSNGHWTWSDGGSLNFTNWSTGEPSQTPSCVRLQSLRWYSTDCANRHIFICSGGFTNRDSYPNNIGGSLSPTSMIVKRVSVQSSAENDVPTLSNSVPSNAASLTPASGTTSPKKVLKFHLALDLKSWNEARNHCRSEHTDLASVPDTDVQTVIAALLVESGSTSPGAWLGLRRNRFHGNWYWVNDQSFDFNYWSEGEPSNQSWEKCGMVSAEHGRNFSWADNCCGAKLPSICYSES